MATKKKNKVRKAKFPVKRGSSTASRRVLKRRRPGPHDRNVISMADRAAKKAQEAAVWFAANSTKRTPVERHEDERGVFTTIENVASFRGPIGAVAVLTRKKGSVFAEHRHEREGHTVHLVSGSLTYREKRGEFEFKLSMTPGDAIFSPPNVPHAFLALEDSVCVVVANIARDQASYERDVTRLTESERLFSKSDILAACQTSSTSSENASPGSSSSQKLSSAVANESSGAVDAGAEPK